MPITGNRINPAVEPASAALIEAFREVVTPISAITSAAISAPAASPA